MPDPRPMTPADIRRQVVLEEHDLSPNGRVAVVGRRSVRGNHYQRHLWAVDVGPSWRSRARRLTRGLVIDSWPRISPDGLTVAFIRTHPEDDDRPAAICLTPMAGGPVRELGAGAHGGVGSLEWSPDGSRLAFTADVDPPRFLVGRVPPISRRGGAHDDPSPLARRMDRVDWRYDGEGHLDRWAHLFVVAVGRRERPRQVTSGDWGVSNFTWHPDGRTVAFATDRGPEADIRPRQTIWSVDVDRDGDEPGGPGSEPREVFAPAGWAIKPAYSPDGRWLAAIGVADHDALDDTSPELLVGPADGGAPPWPLAPDLDRPIGNRADTDLNGWMVSGRSGPTWLTTSRVVAAVTDLGRSRPWVFEVDPASGAGAGRRPLVDGEITVHSLAVSPNGTVSWLGTDGGRAMELMTLEVDDPRLARTRTTMGSAWQRRHVPPVMTVLEVPGPGGSIETWIASPHDAGANALPTVVDIHGGPLGAWAPAPHIEVSLLVARGYRVVLPNIRGSTSYGAGWIRPQLGDWGGVDADDVHAVLDHVIALGLADADRLGVLGLSYGGFMVNWLVGTTDRFRAAVSENGVTNQVSDWANSDSGPDYDRVAQLGDPLSPEGVERLWRQSPLRHVASVQTPLLMLQAEADLRCPPQDNEQFFIALRHLRRTVEYVLYPDESHVFSSSGRPDRRIDRQTRMLDWFDRYLLA